MSCCVDECPKKVQARQMCQMHYRRWALYGDPTFKLKAGNVKPSKYKYIFKPDHPNSTKHGYIHEHRLVMSEIIGRALVKGENVHHINGDTFDNRPENLELWNTHQPNGQRIEDKVKWAVEILELYAPEMLRKTND